MLKTEKAIAAARQERVILDRISKGQPLASEGSDFLKIEVMIPVSTDKWDVNVQADYERSKEPETLIHAIHLNQGPESIKSKCDEAAVASHV